MAPRTLQQRVSGRGFPVFDRGGQTGTGALPDSTLTGTSGPGSPDAAWTNPNLDPGSVPATLPPAPEFISGGLWGLSGGMRPDRQPKSSPGIWAPEGNTHAAPFADPGLPPGEYAIEADAAHAADFGGPDERNNIPSEAAFRFERTRADGGANSNLQPLSGQIRAQAGFDGVQGYGGGGDGVRGTNAHMPLTTDQQSFPGNGYGADGYVNAAEVFRQDVEAVQFIPSAPEFGPWLGGGFDVPTASVQAQAVVTADQPAQGPAVGQGWPASASSFWGG